MAPIDALAKALAIETGIAELTVWRWLAGGTVYPSINRELYAAQDRIRRGEVAEVVRQAATAKAPHEP